MPAETPIRPASTVVVLRDRPRGPEVFLSGATTRSHSWQALTYFPAVAWTRTIAMPMQPGAMVFQPHGLESRGVDPDEALAFYVAAARELFEEAGVLLARTSDGEFLSLTGEDEQERFTTHRFNINGGRSTLRDVVTSEGLRLALDTLVPFAHWVTPSPDVRRFDARFFITRVPPDQVPVHDNHEATDSAWVRPAAAIAAVGCGDFVLPPPTWATLRELERFGSVDEALAWAATRRVHRREPKVLQDGESRRIVLPGDPSMPEPEPVPFETRFVLSNGHWSPEGQGR